MARSRIPRNRKGKYRVRYQDPDGNQRERTFDTEAEAKVFRASVTTDIARGGYIDPTLADTPFRVYAEGWLERKRRTAGSTTTRYRGVLDAALLPHFGRGAIGAIRPSDIDAYIVARQRAGRAPATVRKEVMVLGQIMRSAVRDGLRHSNPCEGVELPASDRREMMWLTPAEVERVADAAGDHYGLLVRFLAYTGLRFGEARALRVEDVDVLRGQVKVRRALKTKSSERAVPVEPDVMAGLRDRLAGRAPHDLVFTTAQGGELHPSNFRSRVWAPALEAARVSPEVRIHDLRHSTATWLIDSGVDVVTVSKWLGHANPTVTLNTYSHLFPHALVEAAERLTAVRDKKMDGPASIGEVEEL